MATKKPKKLNRDKVIAELELLAAGANGGRVEFDDICMTSFFRVMSAESLSLFAYAVRDRFLSGANNIDLSHFNSIMNAKVWENFETLADEIIERRFELDAVLAAK